MKKQILIIDCGSSKVPEIEKMVQACNAHFATIRLTDLAAIPLCDGIIISGAPILLTETNHQPYLEKAKIIFENPNLPILGICFGHQLMGLHHKASIERCEPDRNWQSITFHKPFKLIASTGEYSFMEDHCECITLPEHFQLVASSVTCTNEAMQHHHNSWFGVQFHPEVSGEQGLELFKTFIQIC